MNGTSSDEFSVKNESSSFPYCYNTAAWRLILSHTQRKIVAASIGSTIPPAILLNFLLAFALKKTKQVGSPSKFLFFLLCLSDCFSGFVSIPSSLLLFTVFGRRRCCWLEQTAMFLGQVNGHFSFYLILSIAVQRYLKIKDTMNTHFLATKAGSWTLAVVAFVWSVLHGLISTFFFNSIETMIPNIVMMVIRVIISLTIYICYFFLYRSVKKQHQATVSWSKSSEIPKGLTKTKDNFPTFFRTVYLILITLAICYIPLITMDLWTGYYTLIEMKAAPQLPRFLYYLMHTGLFVNCFLNATIYLYRSKECKDFIKGLFKR